MRCVLLIVIDCLRADHVRAYGYDRETTPTIDRLAADGTLWEKAYSASSWTKPSVTSLLTGLYPSEHGAFEGIKRSKGKHRVTTDVLSSYRPTVAEMFSRSGWRCGAFINNAQLGEFSRLDRGFDCYVPNAGKADHLIGLFRSWLEKDVDKPFFGYLHFLEAHWPYKPRRRHIRMFGGDRDTNCFRDYSARDFGRLRRAVSRQQETLSEQQLAQMIQMYDGAVRRLDGKVKLLLAMLKELGLDDRVSVVVTADHGEEFLDHGRIGHGQSLHEELTHVPLIAWSPGERGGVRHAERVSHVDLAGTLLTMAGVEHDWSGRDLRSRDASPDPVFGELRAGRRYTQCIRSDSWKLHRHYKFQPINGEFLSSHSPLQQTEECPNSVSHELYNLAADPTERNNLAADDRFSGRRDALTSELGQWWKTITHRRSQQQCSDVEIDDTVVQRLRDLGYID